MASSFEASSDAEQLQEIEEFLRDCAVERRTHKKKKGSQQQTSQSLRSSSSSTALLGSKTISPYTVDLVRGLPNSDEFPAPSRAKVAAAMKKKDEAVAKAKQKRLPTNPDDLLDYYASLPQYQHEFSVDEMKVKTLTLPYQDSVMKISEGVRIDKYLKAQKSELPAEGDNVVATSNNNSNSNNSNNSSSSSQTNKAILSIPVSPQRASRQRNIDSNNVSTTATAASTRFHKKYPRFCGSLQFTDAVLHNNNSSSSNNNSDDVSSRRSEHWMNRFMEDCYDAAFTACSTAMCTSTRRRLHNGINCGSLDAFPLLVSRLLAARFSTLEVRRRISGEFLCALQQQLDIAEAAHYREVPGYTDITTPHSSTAAAVPAAANESTIATTSAATVATATAEEVIMFDGSRALLFSKFLSEEYELDVLALFLQKRHVLQKVFGFKFKEANPLRIWIAAAADECSSCRELFRSREMQQQQFAYSSQRGVKRQQQQLRNDSTQSGYNGAEFGSGSDCNNNDNNKRSKYQLLTNAVATTAAAENNSAAAAAVESLLAQKRGRSNAFRSLVSSSRKTHRAAREQQQQQSNADNSNNIRNNNNDNSNNSSNNGGINFSSKAISNNYNNNIISNNNISSNNSVTRKVVPVPLPNHWHYVHDVAVPESPLISFEAGLLSLLCLLLLPQSATEMRTFLSDKIIARCRSAIVQSQAAKNASSSSGSGVALSSTGRVLLHASTNTTATATAVAIRFVPVHLLLLTLCEEWSKVPSEVMSSLHEVGSAMLPLRKLNALYQNDFALMKNCDKQLLLVESDFTAADAAVLQLQKSLRRLERKRAADIASGAELADIEERREELNAAVMNRLEIDARLQLLRERKQKLRGFIDALWNKATHGSSFDTAATTTTTTTTAATTTAAATTATAGVKDWKLQVSEMFIKVVRFNLAEDKSIKDAARRAKLQQRATTAATTATTDTPTAATTATVAAVVAVADPSHRYFIIEVLSKLLVRNAVKVALRRASLQQQLQRQQHQLLLRYGSEEYKQRERDRVQRELNELRRQRLLAATTAAAEAISSGFIADVIDEASKLAAAALFDSWSYLDDEPRLWLPPEVLLQIERRFKTAKQRADIARKAKCFRALALPFKFTRLSRQYVLRMMGEVWNHVKRVAMATLRRVAAARVLQRSLRVFLLRLRLHRHQQQQQQLLLLATSHAAEQLQRAAWCSIEHWRMQASLQRRFKSVQFNLTDRRFIVTFYAWRQQYFIHKYARMANSAEQCQASTKIQCAVRCLLAKRRCCWFFAQRRLAMAIRRCIAVRTVQQQRQQQRLLADRAEGVRSIQNRSCQRFYLQQWQQNCQLSLGFNRIEHAVRCDQLRRRFCKWRSYSSRRTRILSIRAVVIQRTVRRWFIQHWVIDFYKWRRGLVTFQNSYRRRLCMRQFAVDIYYYRAARSIQRVFRGCWLRAHITDKRVEDIHHAAAVNNYDRLLYYVEKYPLLLDAVDVEGNTPLHIAAANAAKRTLKLLGRVKAVDLNRRNFAGYTPLHLTIKSTALNRDDCFLYMIERGFDDEERGPRGKTTLLLAVESDRSVIARHLLYEEDHDPNIPDEDGTTCLQAACWQGNFALVRDLISSEADVNAPGAGGCYPLHDVTHCGSVDIANHLLQHGAYVNVYEPSAYQSPLMWAAAAGSADLIRAFLIQGAEVNARDSSGRTAAHFAATAAATAAVEVGGSSTGTSNGNNSGSNGNSSSRGGSSGSGGDVYDALREADADFEVQDNSGNTPLHLAAQYGAEDFAIHILHGGGFASWQNDDGDQPAHIAARFNQLRLLQQISVYDEHIGRVNYAHQTPLGVAKFHCSLECQRFLELHYRMVEVQQGRNKVGDIWWDKPVEQDHQAGDWEVVVTASSERLFVNKITGEVSTTPPAVDSSVVAEAAARAELPLRRRIVLVKEANKLTKHEYYLQYAQQQQEIKDLSREFVNATIITKYVRRYLAVKELIHLRTIRNKTRILRRFFRRFIGSFMRWRTAVKTAAAVKIQASFRGYKLRQFYFWFPGGEYYMRREMLAWRRLRYQLWSLWKSYKVRQQMQQLLVITHLPRTLADWQDVVDQARRPVRTVGVYEEYVLPNTRNIHFYRHSLTGSCQFEKPRKLQIIDEQIAADAAQVKQFGASLRQINLTVRLQALWRGFKVRSYSDYVQRALDISQHAESDYLNHPEVDSNLYNYALHCFVILQDVARARRAFVEALRRMQWRGPDIPFVLYSYAIFALVSQDEDYSDVMILIQRAQQAELAAAADNSSSNNNNNSYNNNNNNSSSNNNNNSNNNNSSSSSNINFKYGKSYALADAGFFRHYALLSRNSFGWQSYAVCRFLVFGDFRSSFDAFLEAFHFSPEDVKLMSTFNTMMGHFYGKEKSVRDAVVRQRMQQHAQWDAQRQEQQRQRMEVAMKRRRSATRIQNWYRSQKSNIMFQKFMAAVRENIRRKTQQHQQQQQRRSPSRSNSNSYNSNSNNSRPSSQLQRQQPYARRVNIL